ncbi:MAG: cysteine synthase A [Oscillospiraceae bacterium]
MSKIYSDITELIGNTPLVSLSRFAKALNLKAEILGKLERQNPGGSIKDRAALSMILDAQERGLIYPGSMLIEPTSGNTGIGLAAIAAVLGYRAVIVMPDSMSVERRKLIAAYGAEIVLTPGEKGMTGAIEKAQELHEENPGSIIVGQFVNPANPKIHHDTTGPEIWRDSGGRVDIFVATVGTGGTITGARQYLKSQNPGLQVVAVEPAASPVLSGGRPGSHGIQGIGAGFVPEILDTGVYDEVVRVTDEDAFTACRLLAKTEGLLCGISSGAALHAAAVLAKRPENMGRTIAVILPDTGERYLSVL